MSSNSVNATRACHEGQPVRSVSLTEKPLVPFTKSRIEVKYDPHPVNA
jgi:hypothetical protein